MYFAKTTSVSLIFMPKNEFFANDIKDVIGTRSIFKFSITIVNVITVKSER